MYVPARLEKDQLDKIREFEEKKKIRVIALTELELEPALLPADELLDLQNLEKEVGYCLLVVR